MTKADRPLAQVRQNWAQSVDELAQLKLPGETKLRMLIAGLAGANFVTLQMLLLYVTDLMTARHAVELAVYLSILIVGLAVMLSRLPAIARTIQWVGGQR